MGSLRRVSHCQEKLKLYQFPVEKRQRKDAIDISNSLLIFIIDLLYATTKKDFNILRKYFNTGVIYSAVNLLAMLYLLSSKPFMESFLDKYPCLTDFEKQFLILGKPC